MTGDLPTQQRALSSRLSSSMCRRAQSALVGTDPRESIGCLSRQCCEVLGPRSCSPCDKLGRQDRGLSDFQPVHPNLHVSEENFSTTVCAKHRLPDLSTYQIQHKVIRGEIAHPGFKDQATRIQSAVSYQHYERGKFNKSKRRSLSKSSFPYFTSIQDLNRKLISGHVPKAILPLEKGQGQGQSDPAGLEATGEDKSKESLSEMLMPTFISSKQTKPDKPKFTAFYAPPLLPKVCQNVEPAFFVGNT